MKLTAQDALTLGIIERIIEESDIGQDSFYARIRRMLHQEFDILSECDGLLTMRYQRFRSIGADFEKKEADQ